jgi:FkbM family methyltransferase
MILNFKELIDKYKIEIKGIIHIGGHHGQEYDLYKELNIPILYFEPLSRNFSYLENKTKHDPNVIAFQCALGNDNKIVEMNVETVNNGQSSSILKPKKHLEQYPHIVFDSTEEVNMFRLDDIEIDLTKYNFINIDVQGYELEVFKGACNTLKNINYIISEVNRDEVYENCAYVDELDFYLSKFDLERVETDWAGESWGDALYIKKVYSKENMNVYSNLNSNYQEDPARYYNFEKYSHLVKGVDLFFGASQSSKIYEPSNNKKILFATEEQINDIDPNYIVGNVDSYENVVDEILSISPLCNKREKPKIRKYVFQPFDEELEPINKEKKWDVIYGIF